MVVVDDLLPHSELDVSEEFSNVQDVSGDKADGSSDEPCSTMMEDGFLEASRRFRIFLRTHCLNLSLRHCSGENPPKIMQSGTVRFGLFKAFRIAFSA